MAGLVPARFVKSREDPAILVAGVLSRLVVVISAGRALSPDDDAGVDEGVIAEVSMLDSVRIRARVTKGGGAVLLNVVGRMEFGDDQEGVDEPARDDTVLRHVLRGLKLGVQLVDAGAEVSRRHLTIFIPMTTLVNAQ